MRDVELGTGRHVRVLGKGRKARATPLTGQLATLLRAWTTERADGPDDPLFPTRQGGPLSRFTVGLLIGKYADTAAVGGPSLTGKRVTPHVLRHTAAMAWRPKGVDLATIALLLDTRASSPPTLTNTPTPRSRRRRSPGPRRSASSPADTDPADTLLAFLEGL